MRGPTPAGQGNSFLGTYHKDPESGVVSWREALDYRPLRLPRHTCGMVPSYNPDDPVYGEHGFVAPEPKPPLLALAMTDEERQVATGLSAEAQDRLHHFCAGGHMLMFGLDYPAALRELLEAGVPLVSGSTVTVGRRVVHRVWLDPDVLAELNA